MAAKAKGSFAWHRTVRDFRGRLMAADPKYYQRSNSESTMQRRKSTEIMLRVEKMFQRRVMSCWHGSITTSVFGIVLITSAG